METLIIQSKSKSTIKLLFDLARKMGATPVVESHSAQCLDEGLKELKDILKGKKTPKRLDDLLHEK